MLPIKVARLTAACAKAAGDTLVVHDITDPVESDDIAVAGKPGARQRLSKIPTLADRHIGLVDTHDVPALRSDGHHSRS